MLDIGFGMHTEEKPLFFRQAEHLAPATVFVSEPTFFAHLTLAVARDVRALGAGVGHQAKQPVGIGHQAVPRAPAHAGRRQGFGIPDLRAFHAAINTEILKDLPVRAAVAMFDVGNEFLVARFEDIHLHIPDRRIRGDAKFQHRIPLTRVQPVLHDKRIGPPLGQRLVQQPIVLAIIVDDFVDPRDHCFSAHFKIPFCLRLCFTIRRASGAKTLKR